MSQCDGPGNNGAATTLCAASTPCERLPNAGPVNNGPGPAWRRPKPPSLRVKRSASQQAAGTDRAWALGRGVSTEILKQKLSAPRPVPDRPGSTAAERCRALALDVGADFVVTAIAGDRLPELFAPRTAFASRRGHRVHAALRSPSLLIQTPTPRSGRIEIRTPNPLIAARRNCA